jgi:hypothetical protein
MADMGAIYDSCTRQASSTDSVFGVRSDANGKAELTIATRIGKIPASA